MALKIYFLCIIFSFLSFHLIYAQTGNDECGNAINLPAVVNFCSADGEYSTIGATEGNPDTPQAWPAVGHDVWFKFTAIAFDVNITVSGNVGGMGGTLIRPLIQLYNTNDCTSFIEIFSSILTNGNVTTLYKGGLTIGAVYYIRISAQNNNTGTFKLCINNYNPILKAGQDCNTASLLCNKDSFTQTNVVGAGTNNREGAGTCLDPRPPEPSESNCAWYEWTAATSGTLTFTITPTVANDDIDWVLYDLGIGGGCGQINAANAIRCAAGSGVTCHPFYNKTGMNSTSGDLREEPGCPSGQDGFVRYIDMLQNHNYALLVNNFSNGNNGFTIQFGGTGEFQGPTASINATPLDPPCGDSQRYQFDAIVKDGISYKWTFGEGASPAEATTLAPPVVTYSTAGERTIVLQVTGEKGCTYTTVKNIVIGLKPPVPVILSDLKGICERDTLRLEAGFVNGATYNWSGPNGFSSTQRNPSLIFNGSQSVGEYTLKLSLFGCESVTTSKVISSFIPMPQAAFTTDPVLPVKLFPPYTVKFTNMSTNADSYLWDFGDGSTSTEFNPEHIYEKDGVYNITLTAINQQSCKNTIIKGTLTISSESEIFAPNVITPNGDGLNDTFAVTVTYLKTYSISIFDRWGSKLFEANSIDDRWDGTCSGKPVPPATYYYVIDGFNINNRPVKKAGDITVIY